MSASNIVAQRVESHSVCTYSATEMAFNILGLMHPLLFSITQVESIWADLNGGMDRLPDLTDITVRSRQEINAESSLCKAISRDNALDYKSANGLYAEAVLTNVPAHSTQLLRRERMKDTASADKSSSKLSTPSYHHNVSVKAEHRPFSPLLSHSPHLAPLQPTRRASRGRQQLWPRHRY